MIKKACMLLFSCVLIFVLLEGLSSCLVFVYKVFQRSRSSRAFVYHTQYDRDLGWVNIPNYYKSDFFDPGVYVKTNSRGFRSDKEFYTEVPKGKLRIVCSGDSFTFGVGVDNDHTWCERLALMDHRLQTINMGEAGYGIDQMYLHYLRDGIHLSHDVLIVAFVGDDFRRMQLTTISGYEKPVLRIENGELVAHNVPVPRLPGSMRWIMANPDLIFQLRFIQLMQGAVERDLQPAPNSPPGEQREVVVKIIDTLQTINRKKNSSLILVYLPIKKESLVDKSSLMWRQVLRDEASKKGVTFIDLVGDFQRLPKQEVETLFIPAGSQYYASTAGHYSDSGNEFVARQLYNQLKITPDVSKKLESFPVTQVLVEPTRAKWVVPDSETSSLQR